mmetsp:Transcript_26057/g.71685  ORF Transcript_26057/g.71685 Transcript_26057/m.71685 type:complete len:336 (-) Transcript_26057:12-1019(-)
MCLMSLTLRERSDTLLLSLMARSTGVQSTAAWMASSASVFVSIVFTTADQPKGGLISANAVRTADIQASTRDCACWTSLTTGEMSIWNLPSLTAFTACSISRSFSCAASKAFLLSLMASLTDAKSASNSNPTRLFTSPTARSTGEKSTSALIASMATMMAALSTATGPSVKVRTTSAVPASNCVCNCWTPLVTGEKSMSSLPALISSRACLTPLILCGRPRPAIVSSTALRTLAKSTWDCATSRMTGDKSMLSFPSLISFTAWLISAMLRWRSNRGLLSSMALRTFEKSMSGECSWTALTTSVLVAPIALITAELSTVILPSRTVRSNTDVPLST